MRFWITSLALLAASAFAEPIPVPAGAAIVGDMSKHVSPTDVLCSIVGFKKSTVKDLFSFTVQPKDGAKVAGLGTFETRGMEYKAMGYTKDGAYIVYFGAGKVMMYKSMKGGKTKLYKAFSKDSEDYKTLVAQHEKNPTKFSDPNKQTLLQGTIYDATSLEKQVKAIYFTMDFPPITASDGSQQQNKKQYEILAAKK